MALPKGDQYSASTSRIFFPLRTNTSYFDTPDRRISLTSRVKHAALLYDQIYFEAGLYEATVLPSGQFDTWLPPDAVLAHELQRRQAAFQPYGGNFHLTVQLADDPSGRQHPLLAGEPLRRYYAEFHSIASEIQQVDPGLCSLGVIELSDEGKKAVKEFTSAILREAALPMRERSKEVRTRMAKHFARDLVIGKSVHAHTGASVCFDEQYLTLVGRDDVSAPSGMLAIEVLLPDASRVPWDEIVDLRKEACLKGLREQLALFEAETAQALGGGDVSEVKRQRDIQARIIQELVAEVWARTPSWNSIVVDGAVGTLLLPLLSMPGGYGIGEMFNALRAWGDMEQMKGSWYAALFRLSRYT